MNNLVLYLTESEFDEENIEDYKSRIGNNIFNMRSNRDMTQKELAKVANYSRQMMSSIEKGGRDLTSRQLVKLARGLDVTLNDIIYRRYLPLNSGK